MGGDSDGNIDGIKWPKKDSWWDPWVSKLMHGTWSLMHDDGSLMYDGGDCNLNHMANYIRVYFNSMRNSLEGGPDRAQSPNQTQVRRPSMFVQWLQHFFWRPIPRFWLCKPARTHPIRSSVYLCYNRCNGQWDRDARSGKMHDLLWCAHPQVIKLQSRSLAFYRCLFLPPSYSDTSFLVIESSRRIPSSRRIQSKQ